LNLIPFSNQETEKHMHKTPLIFAAVALLVVACTPSDPPQSPPSDSEIASERAQARWNALIAGEHEAAYAYYTPGFREQMSVVDFTIDMRSRPVQWVAAEVIGAECDGDRCELEIDLEYRVPSAPAQLSGMGNRRPIDETWLRIDDTWWFVPGT
jgi:hypothetical protein